MSEAASETTTIDFVERELLSRWERGLDWGEKRRMIARRGDEVLLFVVEGHWRATCGARGFGRTYEQAALVVCWRNHPRFRGHHSDRLAQGRISRAMLASVAAKIDDAFGIEGLAARLDPARTAIVSGLAGAQLNDTH